MKKTEESSLKCFTTIVQGTGTASAQIPRNDLILTTGLLSDSSKLTTARFLRQGAFRPFSLLPAVTVNVALFSPSPLANTALYSPASGLSKSCKIEIPDSNILQETELSGQLNGQIKTRRAVAEKEHHKRRAVLCDLFYA